jgi:monoamine oxidase
VTIVGAGVSGLCAGFELKKAGFNVRILEASSRVGGRVITFHDPPFAPGLHGEGGAMRIPADHYLLRKYIKDFGLESQLFPFEMENKFIYLSGYDGGKTLTYAEFDELLICRDAKLLALFPNLREEEKGKTVDELFNKAVQIVVKDFWNAYDSILGASESQKIKFAYQAITKSYDKYSLRSFLTEIGNWSLDAINLYDLGNPHVVFENGFIESWKDAFLSSNAQGSKAGMEQLQKGMDQVPLAFIDPSRGRRESLIDNITFGARVKDISIDEKIGIGQHPIRVGYDSPSGETLYVKSDYLILVIPYTAQRAITKSKAFAPRQEMAIRDVRYVEVTKVLLQYKTRWWEKVFKDHKQGLDGGVVCDLPIRYTVFPKTAGNSQFDNSKRGVVMAAYTFQQDATILGALSPRHRIRLAAENIHRIFPGGDSLDQVEASASQVFPADELAGGSAFCYFGPGQKSQYLETMCQTDWENRVFFAGEQTSYSHGWIQGALEAGLRCVQQVYAAATEPIALQ